MALVPRDQNILTLEELGTRCAFDAIRDMQLPARYEQRIKHRNLVMKYRIKEAFELPDNNKKSMLTQVDSHFGRER